MNQNEIDQFIQSEVIDINGKLFIAKDKAYTMLVDFAKQQIQKETAPLRKELDEEMKLNDSHRINNEGLIKKISELEKDVEKYENAYLTEESKKDALQLQVKSLQSRISELEEVKSGKLVKWQEAELKKNYKEHSELKDKIEVLEKELDVYKSRNVKLSSQLLTGVNNQKELDNDVDLYKRSISVMQGIVDDAVKERDELKNDKENYRLVCNRLAKKAQEQKQMLHSQINRLNIKIQSLQSRISELENGIRKVLTDPEMTMLQEEQFLQSLLTPPTK